MQRFSWQRLIAIWSFTFFGVKEYRCPFFLFSVLSDDCSVRHRLDGINKLLKIASSVICFSGGVKRAVRSFERNLS